MITIIDINGKEREAVGVFLNPNFPDFVEVQFNYHKEWYPKQRFIEMNPDIKIE